MEHTTHEIETGLSQQLKDGNANTEENNSNYYETKPIENTPFVAIKRGETWMAAMGDYAVTQDHRTEKELLDYIDSKPWALIMTLVVAMRDIDKKREQKETAKQEN